MRERGTGVLRRAQYTVPLDSGKLKKRTLSLMTMSALIQLHLNGAGRYVRLNKPW